VSGATGYIGGRLVPRLLAAGHDVRCLTRSARRLRDVPWASRVEIVEGSSVDEACQGIEVVYHLVNSLGQPGFEEIDRRGAELLGQAAFKAGVRRIVYLGGPRGTPREGVGDVLRASGVPTVVLRAAIIIGSGSASFEMLRHLTERLPVMVTPRWVGNRIQPIAIRDVLRYLVSSAVMFPPDVNRAFDIGGPDIVTYAEMMRRYARVAGLRPRILIPVRVLTPWLSAHWVGIVTPVPNRIARPLVATLIHEAVCHEHDIAQYIPDPDHPLTGVDKAIELALRKIQDGDVETSWANAVLPGAPSDPLPSDPTWSGGTVYTDVRSQHVEASPDRLWRVIEAIGGDNGWHSFPLAWSVRGWLDQLFGGVGLQRGRRDPHRLFVGEALDFWRVEEIVPGSLLRLRAEMKLPGRAWLEMRAGREGFGSHYEQRAIFLPRGLAGHLYWAAVAPFHAIVFGGMARNIAGTAADHK
jgi:uncharacterized protein YbjT (DUF2867 family)